MTPRAAPLTPDERRRSLIEAALPLMVKHGRATTTKQIAAAAGVAEGTIFRVFDSKDDLFTAALEHAADFDPLLRDLRAIPTEQPLRELVGDIATVLQQRFKGMFALMSAMAVTGPVTAHRHTADKRAQVGEVLTGLMEPYADQLSCRPEHFVHVVRMLAFTGSHPHLSDGHPLGADQIVDVVVDGLTKKSHQKGGA